MNGVKSWTVTLVFYFLILAVLIANLDGSSSLFGILPRRANSSQKTPHSHLQQLGITGSRLLRFFQDNLLEFEDVPSVPGDERPGISLYYDSFKKYLYEKPHGPPRPLECNPDKSIVAKLTRDVQPIPVHSHNDYWRDLPLFQGIAHGAISTEADVWLYPKPTGEDAPQDDYILAVGHNEVFLDPVHRTLDKLYTGPLADMLDQVNCVEGHKGGVFYDSPEDTLFFYIDFKSQETHLLYKLLMDKYLKPLADKGYLTYFDLESKKLIWNQITVILTGDFPKDLGVIDNGEHGYFDDNKRYAFQEASIIEPTALEPNASVVSTSSLSELLETCGYNEKGVLAQGQMDGSLTKCIKSMITQSHEAGLKTRIWGVPNWPVDFATKLWHQQVEHLGVDLLNVDNLELAQSVF
ncbi:hypothetical protein ZYGR_0AS06640 [Zygosaccharomyces rouxii]|uniref:Altered inheritance of mitochondria protein 6 n=1 Tax=Zygosaccharomyces rouxii TaxID=4956 RepID=A0A1Q3AI72_ZYGRO|nr:hypothetical protein ZYGR_0AS06640 [Zygosaccharomyces rouxii]